MIFDLAPGLVVGGGGEVGTDDVPVVGMNVLRMLHAKAAVSRTIGLGRIEEDVEEVADRTVSNGVHGDVQAGGVGYYPTSNFLHVDTGRVRHWGK